MKIIISLNFSGHFFQVGLRKTDIDKAYTNCHTDITLPYESIEFITVISKDGEKFDIIRDGRFVVKGTEELNVYLEGII